MHSKPPLNTNMKIEPFFIIICVLLSLIRLWRLKGQLFYCCFNFSPDVCVYKTAQYSQGQQWTDGCQYKCRCDDASRGLYVCNERYSYFYNHVNSTVQPPYKSHPLGSIKVAVVGRCQLWRGQIYSKTTLWSY